MESPGTQLLPSPEFDVQLAEALVPPPPSSLLQGMERLLLRLSRSLFVNSCNDRPCFRETSVN